MKAKELQNLRLYLDRAKKGECFSPNEANDFKELSEKVVHEYPGKPWTTELLKVSWIIFAADAIAPRLNQTLSR
jgi:hypothetical protein